MVSVSLTWNTSSLYRFEGISWNKEENLIAYVAEEPPLPKPLFTDTGFSKKGLGEKDSNSWKGQGDWEEEWGETYFKKRRPTLFVLDISRYLYFNKTTLLLFPVLFATDICDAF